MRKHFMIYNTKLYSNRAESCAGCKPATKVSLYSKRPSILRPENEGDLRGASAQHTGNTLHTTAAFPLCSPHLQRSKHQTPHPPIPIMAIHRLSTFHRSYSNTALLTSNQRRQYLQQHSFHRFSHHKACRRYRILDCPSFRITALDNL